MEDSNTNAGGETRAPEGISAGAKKDIPMGVIAYIGPLVIVSYLVAKDDPFVKFHVKQGLVLFVIEIAAWFIGMIIWPIWMIINLINLAALVLSIVGIVNAVKGEEKEIPFIGKYSSYFKF